MWKFFLIGNSYSFKHNLIVYLLLQDNIAVNIITYVLKDIFDPARKILNAVNKKIKDKKRTLLESMNALETMLADFKKEHEITRQFVQ